MSDVWMLNRPIKASKNPGSSLPLIKLMARNQSAMIYYCQMDVPGMFINIVLMLNICNPQLD